MGWRFAARHVTRSVPEGQVSRSCRATASCRGASLTLTPYPIDQEKEISVFPASLFHEVLLTEMTDHSKGLAPKLLFLSIIYITMTNIFYQFQKGKYTTTPYLLKITQPRQSHNAPIGIFDSGVGGISVLKELYRQLPKETLIYFADTARLPYGTKSQTEIVQFVRQVLTWMQKQGVKMAIIACNTATAAAIDQVALEYNFPIIGMIQPGVNTVVHRGSKRKRIGVIATLHTVNSNAYLNTILKIEGSIFRIVFR